MMIEEKTHYPKKQPTKQPVKKSTKKVVSTGSDSDVVEVIKKPTEDPEAELGML